MKMKFKHTLLTAAAALSVVYHYGQQDYPSLLWEISGNGLEQPSYLYGTMHSTDERVFNLKPAAQEAFEQADAYAMELNIDSVNLLLVMDQLVMDSTYTLRSLLNEEDYTYVESYFRDSLGQPLMLYDRIQPMFVATIATSGRKMEADREDALDLYLFKEAKASGKKVIGLEKFEEQTGAFNSIPYEEQAQQLVETLRHASSTDTAFDRMMEYYIKEDLDKLLEMAESDQSETFSKVFLHDRNQRMADRAEQYMREQSVFIAVGAAHLPGEKGLIELLREKGYTVTPR